MTRLIAVLLLSLIVIGLTISNGFAQKSPRATRNAPQNRMNTANPNTVLIPNRSPLVSFRILFMTGSANDPKGKEGLASLTAALLAEGGTRSRTYAQITDAMYPMATS